MKWVLDTSVTMTWCFDDERTPVTDGLLDRLAAKEEVVVPQVWPLEVANVLMQATRKGRITQAKRRQFLNMLESALINMDVLASKSIFNDVLDLSDKHALSSYDASYLELAMRLGLPLATLDKDLRKAAKAVGVQTLT